MYSQLAGTDTKYWGHCQDLPTLTDCALVLQVEGPPGGGPEAGRGGPPGLLRELAGPEVGVVGGGPADVVGRLDTELPAASDGVHILSLRGEEVTLTDPVESESLPPR